jgi:hypothetical protein
MKIIGISMNQIFFQEIPLSMERGDQRKDLTYTIILIATCLWGQSMYSIYRENVCNT